jgi:hypothetical protein
MGTRKSDKHQLLTRTCTNQTTSWLMHNLDTFGARTSHRQTWIHKIHHVLYNILCAWPQDRHPNVILSRDSQMGVPKFSKLGLMRFCGPVPLCANLRLRRGLKKSCSPCQELFDAMSHATYTPRNWGDFQLLVVAHPQLLFLP